MSVTGQDIVDSARKLLGVWYVWWQDGDPIPMWLDDYGYGAPSRDYFDTHGIMCSDLVNFARMDNGLPPVGGTPAYYDWLLSNGTGEYFDPASPGVAGAICVNPGPWRGDYVLSQGHMSLYTDEHTLIQATDGIGAWAGVHEGEQDYNAGWANYWLYGLMPDVDYGSGAGEVEVPAEEIDSVATEEVINWHGIGEDRIWRLGGEGVDWSRGWAGQRPDGTVVRVK